MSHIRKTSQSNHSPRRESNRRPATANVESTPLMTDALPDHNAHERRRQGHGSPGRHARYLQTKKKYEELSDAMQEQLAEFRRHRRQASPTMHTQAEDPGNWKTECGECGYQFGDDPVENIGGGQASSSPRTKSCQHEESTEETIDMVRRYLSSAVGCESDEEGECKEREGTRGVHQEYVKSKWLQGYEKRRGIGSYKCGNKHESPHCEKSESVPDVTPPAVGAETYSDYWDEGVAPDTQSEIGYPVQAHVSYSQARVRKMVIPLEVCPSYVKPVQLGEDVMPTPTPPPPSPTREREFPRRQSHSLKLTADLELALDPLLAQIEAKLFHDGDAAPRRSRLDPRLIPRHLLKPAVPEGFRRRVQEKLRNRAQTGVDPQTTPPQQPLPNGDAVATSRSPSPHSKSRMTSPRATSPWNAKTSGDTETSPTKTAPNDSWTSDARAEYERIYADQSLLNEAIKRTKQDKLFQASISRAFAEGIRRLGKNIMTAEALSADQLEAKFQSFYRNVDNASMHSEESETSHPKPEPQDEVEAPHTPAEVPINQNNAKDTKKEQSKINSDSDSKELTKIRAEQMEKGLKVYFDRIYKDAMNSDQREPGSEATIKTEQQDNFKVPKPPAAEPIKRNKKGPKKEKPTQDDICDSEELRLIRSEQMRNGLPAYFVHLYKNVAHSAQSDTGSEATSETKESPRANAVVKELWRNPLKQAETSTVDASNNTDVNPDMYELYKEFSKGSATLQPIRSFGAKWVKSGTAHPKRKRKSKTRARVSTTRMMMKQAKRNPQQSERALVPNRHQSTCSTSNDEVAHALTLIRHKSSLIKDDICIEIAKTLTDRLVDCESVKSEVEHIRQLKLIRADHLNHISREVERLQALDTFMDNFSQVHSIYEAVNPSP